MPENVTFQESGLYNMHYRKINNYTSRTNRRQKSVDILLGYPNQNILLNINDVEFDLSMGCIFVLFPFLWIINVQFIKF